MRSVNKVKFKRSYFLIFLFIISFKFNSFSVCTGPLSGNYTIDITTAASGTNYRTFYQAISDLNSCGVSGPVVFNVKAGTYTGAIVLSSYTGVSATNTITFNGGTSGAILTYASTNASSYTVRFSSAKYITVDSLTIVGTGTNYARVIGFQGASEHITIKNCTINCPNVTNSNSYLQAGIYNDNNFSNTCSNLTIHQNIFPNSGTAIWSDGQNTSTLEDSLIITNNKISNFYRTGIQASNQDNQVISNNVIISTPDPTNQNTGISVSGKKGKITNNYVKTDGYVVNFGILLNSFNGTSITNPSIVSNNMVVTTNKFTTKTQYGIYIYGGKQLKIYHNSVHVRSLGNAYGAAVVFSGVSPSEPLELKNNLFVNSGGGLCMDFQGSANNVISDYNAYYSSGVNKFRYTSINYSSLASYQLASTEDSNSIYGFPQFVSDTNLHLVGNLQNDVGDTTISVSVDIDGDARPALGSTKVDIGADEYTPSSCVLPFLLSKYDRQSNSHGVTWNSGGTESSWQLEYGSIGFVQGTGNSSVVSNDSIIIGGLMPQTSYEFYVRGICTLGDSSNWAGPYQFRTACSSQLNGTYTVDPSSPLSMTNYHSIQTLLLQLEDCGMSGPVIVNVASGSGPYVMDVDLNSIPGNSHTNKIVLNGNGVTINKGSNNFFLALDGIKNMKIDNFNFINQVTTEDIHGIMMRNGCDSIIISNNTINVGTATTTNNSACIAASASTRIPDDEGNNAHHCSFINNELIGGYTGISLQGINSARLQNFVIANNTIRDFYYNGIFYQNVDDVIVHNNDINRITRTNSGQMRGIYAAYSKHINITNNKIHHSNASYTTNEGIHILRSENSASQRGKIINNAIYELNSSYRFSGIKLSSNNPYLDIHHNTIIFDFDGRGSSYTQVRGVESYSTPTAVDFRNNIVSISGNLSGKKHAVYFFYRNSTFTNDYNVLHMNSTGGTNYLGHYGGTATDLTAWRSSTADAANSSDVNPIILTDYTPNNLLIDNMADPLLSAPLDLDSNVRNGTNPDVGVVEFTGYAGDVALRSIKLKELNPCYNAQDSALAEIINVFEDTLDFTVHPITVTWEVTGPNNSSFSTVISSGKLAKGERLTVGTASVNMTKIGQYVISGYISSSTMNGKSFNDTLMQFDSLYKRELLSISPKQDTITTLIDSTQIKVKSSFLPEPEFFISEISQYDVTTGRPVGGKPSWMNGLGYIEITGTPNADLAGMSLEIWSNTAKAMDYTFPTGTVLSPQGLAIISTYSGVSSPANFYYTSGNFYQGVTAASGRILKDSNGTIIDAVGFYNYVFPLASGVTSSDWSGVHSYDYSWGYRLEGKDNNSTANWVRSSLSPQDPGTVNLGVETPQAPLLTGMQWKNLKTNTVLPDTIAEIAAGPYTSNGLYPYEFSYITPCGTLRDTAYVFVQIETVDTLSPFSVCDSFLSPYNGHIYRTSGLYSDTVIGMITGYDSIIVTYQLTVNFSTAQTINVVSCDSYTSPSGKVWATSNTYLDTINNTAGCDSVMTFHVTIKNSTTTSNPQVVCDSYILPGGSVATSSGTYRDTLVAANLCDSIVVTTLTIKNSSSSSISPVVCNSYTSPSGKIWTSSNTYSDTLLNAVGCDSIIAINLTVNNRNYASFSRTACVSYTSPSGKIWTSTASYLDTILNSVGCDSIMTINLTINNATTSSISPSVCDRYTSPSGKVWTTSGTYSDTILNSTNCDSIINVNLSIKNSSTSSLSPVVCNSYISPSGKTWTSSAIYLDTIVNVVGCDSIITITLTVNSATSSSISPSVCNTYTSPSGKIWTVSGTYADTISNAAGCDSLITISLSIKNSSTSSMSPTVCGTYTSPSGKTWTSSGTYLDTILNSVGCDSIMTINLTINTSSTSSLSPVTCDSYTSPSGKIWTTSGTYFDTLVNAKGCDSLITINLTINSVNAGTISVSGATLTCSSTGLSYQWLDCNNGFSLIGGETAQVFKPTANGSYSCRVTNTTGCYDTSACIAVNNVGILEKEITSFDVTIYPNPASETVQIKMPKSVNNRLIKLYTPEGKLLIYRKVSNGNHQNISLEVTHLENGVYFVHVIDGKASSIKKLLVSH